jgi:hypothetical protein
MDEQILIKLNEILTRLENLAYLLKKEISRQEDHRNRGISTGVTYE